MNVSVVGWKNTDECIAIVDQIKDRIVIVACESIGDMAAAGYYYPDYQVTTSARYAIQHQEIDGVFFLDSNSEWITYAILSNKNVVVCNGWPRGYDRNTMLAHRVGVRFTLWMS